MLVKLVKDKLFDIETIPRSYEIRSRRATSTKGTTIIDHSYNDPLEEVKEGVVALTRIYDDEEKESERLICSPGFGQLPFIQALYDYHASIFVSDGFVSLVESVVKGRGVETLIFYPN